MNDELIYSLLEISYAKKVGLDTSSNYFEELRKYLPNDWYSIPINERNNILDESIKDQKLASETEAYKNRYPSDALTTSRSL